MHQTEMNEDPTIEQPNNGREDQPSEPSGSVPRTDERTPDAAEEKNVEQILAEENTRLQKEVDVLKDQFLRKVAEFENYRKRTEKEFVGLILNAGEKYILELLPVIDDLERSLKAVKEPKETGTGESFFLGVELIYNKLMKTLEAQGLQTMDPIGKEFDVNQHDALLQMETGEYPPHTVIDQHEKGYLLNGKVIRHAKVIVSK